VAVVSVVSVLEVEWSNNLSAIENFVFLFQVSLILQTDALQYAGNVLQV
jgi:hypothetical protein